MIKLNSENVHFQTFFKSDAFGDDNCESSLPGLTSGKEVY